MPGFLGTAIRGAAGVREARYPRPSLASPALAGDRLARARRGAPSGGRLALEAIGGVKETGGLG